MAIPQPTTNKINIRFGKFPVVQQKFKSGKKEFTRKQIIEHVNRASKVMKEKGFYGYYTTSLLFPKGWRGSRPEKFNWKSPSGTTQVGKKVILYSEADYAYEDPEDPETYKQFRIYWIQTPPPKLGTDYNNDCVYNCLRYRVSPHEMPWKTPEDLKSFLGLKRKDKIDLSAMSIIESALPLKYKITITGDHIYTSMRKTPHDIRMIAEDEHVTLEINDYILQEGVAYEEKKPLIFADNHHCFDGKNFFNMEESEFHHIRSNPCSSEFILIPIVVSTSSSFHRSSGSSPHGEKSTFEETYKQFIKDADYFKAQTNGIINLYKTGTGIKTARDLFYKFNRCIIPDVIKMDEGYWISLVFMGALIWSIPYTGQAYKYDVVSRYPSIMQSTTNLYPIKAGEFKLFTQDELINSKFFQYGIYRCEINVLDNHLFKKNRYNYYTHIDMNRAKELNYEMTMVNDSQPNFLYYSRDKLITGRSLFREYIEILFPLKKSGNERAKFLITSIWGALAQKKLIAMRTNDKVLQIKSGRTINSFTPVDEDSDDHIVKFYENKYVYETNYARIAPFLVSKARNVMSKMIEPFISHVKRFCVDGFITDIKLDIKTGTDLGELRYEGECDKCIITNCRKPQGIFKI